MASETNASQDSYPVEFTDCKLANFTTLTVSRGFLATIANITLADDSGNSLTFGLSGTGFLSFTEPLTNEVTSMATIGGTLIEKS